MKLFRLMIAVVLIVLSASAALAGNEVVAKVNGKPITAFELNEEFQDLLPLMGAYHGGFPAEKVAEISEKALNSLIEKELKYQYALEKGLSVSKKEVGAEFTNVEKRFGSSANFKDALKKSGLTKEDLKGVIKKRLLSAKAKEMEVTSKAALSDAELKEYFEKNKGTFKRPLELRASHILIGVDPAATKEEKKKRLKLAENLLAKARAGEDFAKLASRYSTDEGSAPIGGDIGAFHIGMADPAFEKAALSLKVGEVSDHLVETLYGYHIILLTEKKPEVQLTFDEVKADLKKKLEKKRGDELYKNWIDGLRAKAIIEKVKK